jgi:xeroderma pigmentosum group C-complementing protein
LSPVESDSEIEKGSLLSEDPEDEDAVPDWLMFD